MSVSLRRPYGVFLFGILGICCIHASSTVPSTITTDSTASSFASSFASSSSIPVPLTLPVYTKDIFIPSTGICYRIPAIAISPVTSTILMAAERRRPTCDDFNTSHDLVLVRMDPVNYTVFDQQILINDNDAWYNPTFIVDKVRSKVHILINRTPLAMNVPDILLCHLYTRETYILTSDDDGMTWSLPRNISEQVQPIDWRCHSVGPGSGIQVIVNSSTQEDLLIVPAYHSLCNTTTDTIDAQISGIFYSNDGGIQWNIGGILPSNSTNECQVTLLSNSSLLMMTRMSIPCNAMNSSEGYCRGTSYSNDYGLSWSEVTMNHDIIDPACEGSIVNNLLDRSAKGDMNITSLFVSVAHNPTVRTNVSLFRSDDQGNSFQLYQPLTNTYSGYSQLTILPNNQEIGCLYENGNNGTLSLARVPIV